MRQTDRVLIYNEKDLHTLLRDYISYYNLKRVHSARAFNAPKRDLHREWKEDTRPVCRQKVLDGLITDFFLAA
jgi:hypothetical protein